MARWMKRSSTVTEWADAELNWRRSLARLGGGLYACSARSDLEKMGGQTCWRREAIGGWVKRIGPLIASSEKASSRKALPGLADCKVARR